MLLILEGLYVTLVSKLKSEVFIMYNLCLDVFHCLVLSSTCICRCYAQLALSAPIPWLPKLGNHFNGTPID